MSKKTYKDPPLHIKFGSREHLEWGQVALFEQTKLIQKAHDQIINPNDKTAMAISVTLIALVETSKTILLICRSNVRDSFSLCRILLDTTLNLAIYILKPNSVEKALKHATQKSFRDLFRYIDFEDYQIKTKLSDIDNIALPDNLRQAYEEFTGNNGEELMNWSDESKKTAYSKIRSISSNLDPKIGAVLNFCLFSIYRHSSEVIHGTLFGSFFGLGMTSENDTEVRSKEDYQVYVNNINSHLMSVLNLLMQSALKIVHKSYPIPALIEHSRELCNDLTERIAGKKA